jgi:hypothetical protein
LVGAAHVRRLQKPSIETLSTDGVLLYKILVKGFLGERLRFVGTEISLAVTKRSLRVAEVADIWDAGLLASKPDCLHAIKIGRSRIGTTRFDRTALASFQPLAEMLDAVWREMQLL